MRLPRGTDGRDVRLIYSSRKVRLLLTIPRTLPFEARTALVRTRFLHASIPRRGLGSRECQI
jgi:hypothetical protein